MRSINRAASKRYLRYLEAENRWNMRRERWVASRMRTWPSKMRYAASEQSKAKSHHSTRLPAPPSPTTLLSLSTDHTEWRHTGSSRFTPGHQHFSADPGVRRPLRALPRRKRRQASKEDAGQHRQSGRYRPATGIGGVALSAGHMDRNAYVSDGGEDE